MRYERGRYRAEEIIVRELKDGAKIVFYNEQKIYLFPKNGWGIVFHRWGTPEGFYLAAWKIFRQRLKMKKKLDANTCCRIATQYAIPQLIVYKSIDEILEGGRCEKAQKEM